MTFIRNYCLLCGRICKKLLCQNCKTNIIPFSKMNKKRCKKCSKPLEEYEEEMCNNCIKREFYFEKNTSLYPYNHKGIKEIVRLFKFEFIEEAGNELAGMIEKEVRDFINSYQYDLVICVPVSKESYKERGFNPVAYILDRIKISYKNILGRKSHIIKQSELSVEERGKYIKGQFYFLNRFEIKDKKILIIDDIFTSGNTLNEISRILIEEGADKVDTLTFFRD